MPQTEELQEGDTILKLEDIHMAFGKVQALNGIDLEVRKGEIHSIIGPNGAGKTVMMNCINGLYRPQKGDIYYKGEKINHLSPHKRAELGIGRTFQISEVPDKMTVLENLLLAPKGQSGEGILNVFLHPRKVREEHEKCLKKVHEILELVQLYDLRNDYAGNLSGGQKKLLSLGRILMSEPALLLLDEPTAGVNPTLIKNLMVAIRKLKDEAKKTVLLVEHNMKVISGICDKVIVLDFGKKIAEGTPEEIQKDEKVLEAYLSGSSKREKKHEAF